MSDEQDRSKNIVINRFENRVGGGGGAFFIIAIITIQTIVVILNAFLGLNLEFVQMYLPFAMGVIFMFFGYLTKGMG